MTHNRDNTYTVRMPVRYPSGTDVVTARVVTGDQGWEEVTIKSRDLTPAGRSLAGSIVSTDRRSARGSGKPLMVRSLVTETERARILERDDDKAEHIESMIDTRYLVMAWPFDGRHNDESSAAYINRLAHEIAAGLWQPAYTDTMDAVYRSLEPGEPTPPSGSRSAVVNRSGHPGAIGDLMTSEQAAAEIGVTRQHLTRLSRRMGIGRRIGRDILYSPDDIGRLHNRNTTPGRPPASE